MKGGEIFISGKLEFLVCKVLKVHFFASQFQTSLTVRKSHPQDQRDLFSIVYL